MSTVCIKTQRDFFLTKCQLKNNRSKNVCNEPILNFGIVLEFIYTRPHCQVQGQWPARPQNVQKLWSLNPSSKRTSDNHTSTSARDQNQQTPFNVTYDWWVHTSARNSITVLDCSTSSTCIFALTCQDQDQIDTMRGDSWIDDVNLNRLWYIDVCKVCCADGQRISGLSGYDDRARGDIDFNSFEHLLIINRMAKWGRGKHGEWATAQVHLVTCRSWHCPLLPKQEISGTDTESKHFFLAKFVVGAFFFSFASIIDSSLRSTPIRATFSWKQLIQSTKWLTFRLIVTRKRLQINWRCWFANFWISVLQRAACWDWALSWNRGKVVDWSPFC